MNFKPYINLFLRKLYALSLIVFFYLYKAFSSKRKLNNEEIPFIIFSKDRSIQLHALLSSIFYYVSGPFNVWVLYSTEEGQHDHSYEQLINEFEEKKNINFYKQGNSFSDDLIQIVKGLDTERIFFLVDDIIFKRHIDLKDLNDINIDSEVFSLRHGNHLNYSYVVSKMQKLPEFKNKDKHFLTWNWSEGELDWAYPLSVDGHLFNTSDVLFWVSNLKFNSPNSFEHSMQYLIRYYIRLKGVCYNQSVIFNNPCNKVQSEVVNIHGTMHQSELLKLWNEGYIIDFKTLEGYNNSSVHEEVNFTLKKRSDFE